mgnify:CR=1 FL=1
MSVPTKFNLAYNLAKFFIENSRITILLLIFLILVSLGSLLALRTTGFPSPQVNVVVINAAYPGATPDVVLKEVVRPIESVVLTTPGVDNVNSISRNSIAQITAFLKIDAEVNQVITDIQKKIDSLTFPENVTKPNVFSPKIASTDFIFAITAPDRAQLFTTYTKFKNDLLNLTQIESVTAQLDLGRKIVVVVDKNKLRQEGIEEAQIKAQLASIGQTLPVAANVTINEQNKVISASFDEVDLIEQIRDFPVFTTPRVTSTQSAGNNAFTPKAYKLGDLATVKVDYFFVNDRGEIVDDLETFYGFNQTNMGVVVPSVLVNVKAVAGTDLLALDRTIQDLVNQYSGVNYLNFKQTDIIDTQKINIIQAYSINEQSKKQVDEVVSGLLQGAVLVFVVMLIFVSWRAAILASVGIPLSLAFAIVYILLVGENLNTLVLFSLVLVIGLVVDPALVVLESVQRKKDLGLNFKEAVLESMKDIGDGLLSSTLTNIIVFFPFAIVSGVLGKIFSYIPLTIIPALVGSYLVAIIFLAWLGGFILKRNPKASDSEEKNLWPVSKWVIKVNEFILNVNASMSSWKSVLLRFSLIVLVLVIPIITTAYLFSSGKLKAVQFTSNPNAPYLQLSGEFLTNLPQAKKLVLEQELLKFINQNEAVYGTTRQGELRYIILLKERQNRGQFSSLNSKELAYVLNQQVQEKFGQSFFDIQVELINNGPGSNAYQVSLAIKSEDLQKLKEASVAIGKLALEQVCQISSSTVEIKPDCPENQRVIVKVDDGFTNRENRQIGIIFDRGKILENGLYLPNTPLLAFVSQQIAQKYPQTGREKVGKINFEGVDSDILLVDSNIQTPTTTEELANLEILSPIGRKFTLKDIAEIKELTGKQTITRLNGETVNELKLRLNQENADNRGLAAQIGQKLVAYYAANDFEKTKELGLEPGSVDIFSTGSTAEFTRTFTELGIALVVAIFLVYFLLVALFRSFLMPIAILFTIPMAFLGSFPALAWLVGNEFGFLEIIGLVILVGLVVNTAIYLIDLANQKIAQGWDLKKAIAFASGVRLRPVFLTNVTSIASLIPLFFTSDFYKSIAATLIFGLVSSTIVSLFTTPILFVFFKWLSDKYRASGLVQKISFILAPILGLMLGLITLNRNLLPVSVSWLLTIFSVLLVLVPFGYIVFWSRMNSKVDYSN